MNANTMAMKSSLEADLSHNWPLWYQQFKTIMKTNGIEKKSNSLKINKFLRYVAYEALSIFNFFDIDVDTCKDEDLIKRFEQHCNGSKQNLIADRHNFFTRMQKSEETIDEFVTSLNNLSLPCEFSLLRESLVRDMFIKGLKSSNATIKEKLLQQDNLSLEGIVKIAKSIEEGLEKDKQLQNEKNELIFVIDEESIEESNQFNLLRECLIRGRVIKYLGSSNAAVEENLMQEDNLSFENPVHTPINVEESQKQVEQLQNMENGSVCVIDTESSNEYSLEVGSIIEVDDINNQQELVLLSSIKDISGATDTTLPITNKEEKADIKEESEGNNTFECNICNKKFAHKSSLNKHILVHTKKPYQCSICHSSFSEEERLQTHLRVHHGEKPFHCKICKSSFTVKKSLMTHMLIHSGEKPFQCEICNYSTTTKSNLKNHVQTHMNIHTANKIFQCNVCDYKSVQKRSLQKHIQVHTGEKPYCCQVCGFRCSQSTNLRRHMRVHTGEKPYQCDKCGHKCSQKNSLDKHKTIHNKGQLQAFQCHICSYTSALKNALRLHMRRHTGEKPYQCDICDFKCSQKNNLNTHKKIHHKNKLKAKSFQCHICSSAAISKGALRLHMRRHTGEKPFQCDICGFRTSLKASLEVHIRVHTGEKPFQCHICGFTVSKRGNLDTHIRIHTGEKPYECNVCTYKCAQRSTLQKHVLVHRKAELK